MVENLLSVYKCYQIQILFHHTVLSSHVVKDWKVEQGCFKFKANVFLEIFNFPFLVSQMKAAKKDA